MCNTYFKSIYLSANFQIHLCTAKEMKHIMKLPMWKSLGQGKVSILNNPHI